MIDRMSGTFGHMATDEIRALLARLRPLLPRRLFALRLVQHGLVSAALVGLSLGLGVVGYRATEGLSWLDALLNASMILGGMGPVDPLHTRGGKLFASFYALYSGIVFLVAAGLIFTPVAHRIFQLLHLEAVAQAEARPPDPAP